MAVSGQLILINGFASFLGPIIGVRIMGAYGLKGILIYIAVIAAAFVALAVYRTVKVAPPEKIERPFIILNDRMSQAIAHVAEDPAVGQHPA